MQLFKIYSSPIGFYWVYGLISIFFSTESDVLPQEPGTGEASRLAYPSSPALAHRDNDFRDACRPRRLSPALWSKLQLNEYLLQYPGGEDTSLEELAVKAGLLNFDCGIDKLCYAGQLCSPVKGKAWYVLVAAQEWNSYMNVVYQAVGFAMTMIQGIIPSMIKDFFPDKHDDWAIAKAYLTFLSACAKVHPTEGHISDTKWWMQLIQGQIGLSAGEANIMDYAVIPDPVNQHDKWTYFIYQLSKNQDSIQSKLAQNSENIISSGISTEQGIYGALKDGGFLIDHVHCQSLSNLAAGQQSEMKLSIQLNLLTAIWKKQKFFILRGSEPCVGDGENGASSGKNQLSYCDPNNIMMKIVQLKSKNQIVDKIHNGHLVFDKYNFTAGFLTERAFKCQSKTKQFQPEVWNSTKPIEIDSECSFNLAVCDLTSPETRELKQQGRSAAHICKKVLGLPI